VLRLPALAELRNLPRAAFTLDHHERFAGSVTRPPGRPRGRALAALWRDKAGANAVEFGLVLPALLALLWAIVEIGHLLWAVTALNMAVEDAAQFAAIFGADAPLAWDQERGEQLYAYLAPAVRATATANSPVGPQPVTSTSRTRTKQFFMVSCSTTRAFPAAPARCRLPSRAWPPMPPPSSRPWV